MPDLAEAGIRAMFTTRHGGSSTAPYASLNLSFVSGDDPGAVRANRARVVRALGAAPEAWTSGRQIHDARAARIGVADRGAGATEPGTAIEGVDVLWTDEPGIPLAVLTADCAPILLADPARGRIGVVHAGWRGLIAGVVEAGVSCLGTPGALRAWVGPTIGPCCYEVGDEVAGPAADALGDEVVRIGERPHLDLWRGVVGALRRSGVTDIALAMLCTRCEPHRFFSHRAGDAGRQGLIAMRTPVS